MTVEVIDRYIVITEQGLIAEVPAKGLKNKTEAATKIKLSKGDKVLSVTHIHK